MSDLEAIKRAPDTDILDAIAHRWSPRAFSDKPVSTDDLRRVFTAASWAGSSTNEQPWRFLFGRKGDATFAKILDSLAPQNQGWAKNAPVLFFSVARREFSPDGYGKGTNYHALHDTGAASAQLSLQATALGLHTHAMGGYDHEKARANLAIPEEFHLGAAWALGYLGDPESLPDPMKARELAPRSRKAISEFVFGEWDTPAEL